MEHHEQRHPPLRRLKLLAVHLGLYRSRAACPDLPVCRPEKLDLDKERKVRTPEEMAAEAAQLRTLFQ